MSLGKEKLKHRITISLDEDTFENVSRIASENDGSIAWVIRCAVGNLLKQRKEGRHQQLLLPEKGRSFTVGVRFPSKVRKLPATQMLV